MLTANAPAKLNLSLEVLGRRPDGYHELLSVMIPITVCDELTFETAPTFAFSCTDPELEGMDNLVMQAAREVQAQMDVHTGARIHLTKQIPVAAGLGGGSSDAAATLAALPHVWNVSAGCGDLFPAAALIGSDVPFFLYGSAAIVSGRGDIVRPLPPPPPRWFLLANPGIRVSTANIFGALQRDDWSDGSRTRAVAEAMRSGDVVLGVNSLQNTLFRLYPEAKTCYDAVSALAPGRTLVTGSGPTVFALFNTLEETRSAQSALGATHYWTEIAQFCTLPTWQRPCAPSPS